MTSPETSTAILTIDLDALGANYRLLDDKLGPASLGAAVKADAYGLGSDRAVQTLQQAGCEDFFVAVVDEGMALRKTLPDARIHILGGVISDDIRKACIAQNLIPVLNSLADIAAWKEAAPERPCDIHMDTGMLRLVLPPDETALIANNPGLTEGLAVDTVLSHLAVADEANNPKNAEQLAAFTPLAPLFKGARASLANSSGIFLGPDYHFDLARAGVALYGGNPTPGEPNPMAQVIRLQGKILQVRDVDTPQTVGYGATHRVKKPGRVATVGVGYADGYLRSLSNTGCGYIGKDRVPLIGRVSMDLITFDVTDVPVDAAHAGALVDLVGPNNPVDDVAESAGTIAYEILTSLGPRLHRIYQGGH
ncbi:MAG: alanine racemase [Rhodospirillaceae bacterium]|nr:alanine racemase [Rhodospirillaceae bacterium]